jgi:hypothetical protein
MQFYKSYYSCFGSIAIGVPFAGIMLNQAINPNWQTVSFVMYYKSKSPRRASSTRFFQFSNYWFHDSRYPKRVVKSVRIQNTYTYDPVLSQG